MEETNKKTQELKQAIFDYYIKKIQEENDIFKEDTIEKINIIGMQFVEEKIGLKNSTITKDEIFEILEPVLYEDIESPIIRRIKRNNLESKFPKVATVTIEDGEIARIYEEGFLRDEEKNEYLYVSEDYYTHNIQDIESEIKQLEKGFSAKELEMFDEQFSKDTIIKNYELENAREYDNALAQINQREKKFKAVRERMISDYGVKYQEIMAQDILEQEKNKLLSDLLLETKSYDSKTNEAYLQIEIEKRELHKKFANKAKSPKQIIEEMTDMNLFSREKYLQDKKGDVNPELAELYAKRDELNAYRKEHGQPVYEVKTNVFVNILNTIARNMRGEKEQLLLEYHPERDIATGINSIIDSPKEGIDEELIKALAHLYGEQAKKDDSIDTTEFEAHLVKYFRVHYNDLMEEGYNHFLSEFAKMPDESSTSEKEGELAQIARKYGIDPHKFHCFGYKFSIAEGLIYEKEIGLNTLGEVYYATDKGINRKIEDLYGHALYEDHTSNGKWNDTRKLKNGFIEYAKKHGIKIEKEYVLEKMEVNQEKVEQISKYLNELINEKLCDRKENYQAFDYTEQIAQDITENYSTIMNLDYYNFFDLQAVKNIVGNDYFSYESLDINEDSILEKDEFSHKVVYATPEYCAREYKKIMEQIEDLNRTTNPFFDGYFDIQKANAKKTALREYIEEHGFDIDISITQVPINEERITKIADAMVEMYGEKVDDTEKFKKDITVKLHNNWSEIVTEMKVVDIGKLFEEELEERFVDEHLYVEDDLVYIGDYSGCSGKCIEATPEVINENVARLNDAILGKDEFMVTGEIKKRDALLQYAKEKNFKLDEIKSKKEIIMPHQAKEMMNRFFLENLPDDPTAREKINPNDTIMDAIVKMAEGNPGAVVGLSSIIKENPMDGYFSLLGLDDMNIRGSQIWIAYKDYCQEDPEKFSELIKSRSQEMVDFVNEMYAVEGREKAVTGGASFDRSKMPSKYRFTSEEVEKIQEDRDKKARHQKFERLKAKEQAEKRERKSKTKLDIIREKRENYKSRKIFEGQWNKINKEISKEREER